MPFESMLMAMLLEEHKLILQLKARIEQLEARDEDRQRMARQNDFVGLAL